MRPDRSSATARLIAAATVLQAASGARNAPPDGAPPWCARFLGTSRLDRLLLRSVRSGPGRACWRRVESFALAGIVAHWMARKREIDRVTQSAARDGFRQLVVLGAGLDTLAFRADEQRLFERVISADHPATLRVLRAALAGTAHGVELIEIDLNAQEPARVLAHTSRFDPSLPTVVVVEGVLMYLDESAVHSVLASIAVIPAPALRLIASFMVRQPDGSIGFANQSGLVRAWLSRRREPMLWAAEPATIPDLLRALGWSDATTIDLTHAGGLPSERLILAARQRPVGNP